MSAVSTSWGEGRYGSGTNEVDVVFTSGVGPAKPPVIFCHQHGIDTRGLWYEGSTQFFPTLYQHLWHSLAQDFTVVVADVGGGEAWGNVAARQTITDIRTMLANDFGIPVATKVGLVGVSMGGGLTFNYAKANASTVAFVANVLPLVNLQDLKGYSAAYANEIDAAYGGAYSDTTHGPTSSPHIYQGGYPSSTVPTAVWSTLGDPVTKDIYTHPFLASNPEILHQQMVAPGEGSGFDHSEAAIYNATQGSFALGPDSTASHTSPMSTTEWCRQFAASS